MSNLCLELQSTAVSLTVEMDTKMRLHILKFSLHRRITLFNGCQNPLVNGVEMFEAIVEKKI